jgi:hypothetical protein
MGKLIDGAKSVSGIGQMEIGKGVVMFRSVLATESIMEK